MAQVGIKFTTTIIIINIIISAIIISATVTIFASVSSVPRLQAYWL